MYVDVVVREINPQQFGVYLTMQVDSRINIGLLRAKLNKKRKAMRKKSRKYGCRSSNFRGMFRFNTTFRDRGDDKNAEQQANEFAEYVKTTIREMKEST